MAAHVIAVPACVSACIKTASRASKSRATSSETAMAAAAHVPFVSAFDMISRSGGTGHS